MNTKFAVALLSGVMLFVRSVSAEPANGRDLKQAPQNPPPQATPALAPELAPYAAKHRADLATLDQQRTAALAAKLPFYLTPLDTAEKNALAQAKLDAVAAIQLERDAVKGGKIGDLIAAKFPEKLPAGLKSARDSLFESYKRIEADVLKLRQKVDADYLRALAALQQRAAGKAELLAQIKAESDAVLGKPVTKPEGEVEVATKTGKLINGDFTQADGNGFPVGWKLVDHMFEENAAPAGETYKVMQENNRSFLHTAFEQPAKDFHVVQIVEIPRIAKELEIKFQVRGNVSKKGNNGWFQWTLLDDKGKTTGYSHDDFQPDSTWKTYSKKQKLDAKAGHKQVRVQLHTGDVTGFIDWSRIELHFK